MFCPAAINAKNFALSCAGTARLVPKGTPYFFVFFLLSLTIFAVAPVAATLLAVEPAF